MAEVQMNPPDQRISSVARQNPDLRSVRETIHLKRGLSEQQVAIGVWVHPLFSWLNNGDFVRLSDR